MVPMFYLVAVFAGPLHAQVCSGGAGGGTDAVGNQCSTPNDVAEPASRMAKPAATRQET